MTKLKKRLKGVNDLKTVSILNDRNYAYDTPEPKAENERIVSVAIIRDGGNEVESRGFKSHAELRRAMGGYEDPYKSYPEDIEGFLTNTGRFVGRYEASEIAAAAGQCPPMYAGRKLLSSDIDVW